MLGKDLSYLYSRAISTFLFALKGAFEDWEGKGYKKLFNEEIDEGNIILAYVLHILQFI